MCLFLKMNRMLNCFKDYPVLKCVPMTLTVIRTEGIAASLQDCAHSTLIYPKHNHSALLLCLLQSLHYSLFSKVCIIFPAEHICFCPIMYLIGLYASILDSVWYVCINVWKAVFWWALYWFPLLFQGNNFSFKGWKVLYIVHEDFTMMILTMDMVHQLQNTINNKYWIFCW